MRIITFESALLSVKVLFSAGSPFLFHLAGPFRLFSLDPLRVNANKLRFTAYSAVHCEGPAREPDAQPRRRGGGGKIEGRQADVLFGIIMLVACIVRATSWPRVRAPTHACASIVFFVTSSAPFYPIFFMFRRTFVRSTRIRIVVSGLLRFTVPPDTTKSPRNGLTTRE